MKSLAGASTGALEDVGGWTGRYLHVLKIAIGHPIKLLAGALAILIVSYAAYLGFGKGFEFFRRGPGLRDIAGEGAGELVRL